MRTTTAPGSIAFVNSQVQRITIELDAGEPIRGRLIDGAGEEHPFRGWLELSAMLERMRQGGSYPLRQTDPITQTEDA